MDKPNFLEFWVEMAKMTLRVKANDLKFQYHPRVPHNACLVEICCFQIGVGTGPPFQIEKVSGNNRAKTSYTHTSANKGFPTEMVNHIQPNSLADCVEYLPGPPPHKMQMGHPYTGDFNAMV